MSGKRRIVIVHLPADAQPVSDGSFDWVDARENEWKAVHDIPIPPDDQLTRDIEGGIAALEIEAQEERDKERMYRDSMPSRADKYQANAEVAQGMADRLRAAFHLDERPSLDDVLSHGRARFGLDEGNES